MSLHEGSNDHIPQLQQVSAAYNEINTYNQNRTGFGSLFSSILEATLQGPSIDEQTDTDSAEDIYERVNDSLSRNAVESDMHSDLERIVHDDVFTRIGIKLLPSGSHVRNCDGKRVSGQSLKPYIANDILYKDFLGTITQEDLAISESKTLLTDAAANVLQIISSTLNTIRSEEVTDEGEEDWHREVGESALRTWVAVEDEYRRLGLEDMETFVELNHYVEYWGRGLLPEYITASNKDYVRPEEEQRFGPARWSEDMSAEGLAERWSEAIDFSKALADKDKAGDFAALVHDSLLESVKSALVRQQSYLDKRMSTYDDDMLAWIEHGFKSYREETYDEQGRIMSLRYIDDPDFYVNNIKELIRVLVDAQSRLIDNN